MAVSRSALSQFLVLCDCSGHNVLARDRSLCFGVDKQKRWIPATEFLDCLNVEIVANFFRSRILCFFPSRKVNTTKYVAGESREGHGYSSLEMMKLDRKQVPRSVLLTSLDSFVVKSNARASRRL
jgi:hypothetical protein